MISLRLAGSAAIVGLVLAGCGPATTPTSATPDLVAARRAGGIAECPRLPERAPVPRGMPQVSLDCLGGGEGLKLSNLRGPMLVNFWAQWCEPCRAEGRYLAEFAKSQSAVAVLGINYSDPQPGMAIEFARLVGATYPQLVDPESATRMAMGVPGIPYTVLIDRAGVVVATHPGEFTSKNQLELWVANGLGR